MSQLLATLYPDKFVPPKGRLVPRPRVIQPAREEDRNNRTQAKEDNKRRIYQLIQQGINTAAEVSDYLNFTRATVSGYFRELEQDGLCYRIEHGPNIPLTMHAY